MIPAFDWMLLGAAYSCDVGFLDLACARDVDRTDACWCARGRSADAGVDVGVVRVRLAA